MNRRTKIGLGAAGGLLALVLAGGGIAAAVSGDGGDGGAVGGAVAAKAQSAAAAAVPGGKAGAVRSESDQGTAAYDIAVTKPDGSVVDVHLTKSYQVLSVQPQGQENDEQGGSDGDGG